MAILFPAILHAEIRIGYTADLSQENKDYHNAVGRGLDTYFRYVNNHNGIRGQQVNLIVIDNANDLTLFKKSLMKLSQANAKIIIANPLPIYGSKRVIENFLNVRDEIIFSKNLNYQTRPLNFVSYKVSYNSEVEELIDFVKTINKLSPEEIAIYSDGEDYSKECQITATNYLTKLGAWSERVTIINKEDLTQKDKVFDKLPQSKVKAFLLCANPKAIPGFMDLAIKKLPQAAYFTVSMANTAKFASTMPSAYNGFLVAQTTPSYKANLPIAVEFKQLFTKFYPGEELTTAAFEGFILAKIIIASIQASNADYTPESFLQGLNSFDAISIGLDLPLFFSPNAINQGIDRVWFAKLVDQELVEPQL